MERKRRLAAKRAVQTINESEKGYIPVLAKLLGINQRNVFHHVGLPDLIVIRNSGELEFYEMKPVSGDRKKRLLNKHQWETVKRLLELGLRDIYIVRYQKHGNQYSYQERIKLSTDNLKEYCL